MIPVLRAAAVIILAACALPAQQQPPTDSDVADEPITTFGVTVVDSQGLRGQIYLLKPWAKSLPKKADIAGTVYTNALNIQPREFTEGFPGITDRLEWFGIDYTGRFWIEKPGDYAFRLTSDDGAKLFIDDRIAVDNWGLHPPRSGVAVVSLKQGSHNIHVQYFQGPRFHLALVLSVLSPGESRYHVFNMRDFLPPQPK